MSAFSKVRDFFSRHRNKFLVGGVLITGSIFLSRYARRRIGQWQEKEAAEFFERTRKQQHFESIDRTCNQTILNLFTSLCDKLANTVNTEEIIELLQRNPENKIKLWNDLKVLLFTKIGCLIYSSVLLVVTLRIQLSIIGGYLYKDPSSVSIEMQERYLCLCQNLMDTGMEKLHKLMESECKRILEPVELKKELKISDLEALFWSLQTAVAIHDDNPIENMRKLIIPEDMPTSNGIYSNILEDTSDFLESDEVKSLTTHCINRGFILLCDLLSEYYVANGSKIVEISSNVSGSDQFQNPFETKKPLAKLLPIMNGLFTKPTLPTKLIQMLTTNERISSLGANVYECLL